MRFDLNRKGQSEMKTINATPKWEDITPFLLKVLEEGKIRDSSDIKAELIKMSRLADLWVEHCKAQEGDS